MTSKSSVIHLHLSQHIPAPIFPWASSPSHSPFSCRMPIPRLSWHRVFARLSARGCEILAILRTRRQEAGVREGGAQDSGAASQKGLALPSAPPAAVSGLAWIHAWSQPSTSPECLLGRSAKVQPAGAISHHGGEARGPAPNRPLQHACPSATFHFA